ncbi:hypothetical protein EG68_07876 [Paragonimus skrjabini miyazakii]|uniref:RNA-binding protein 42 n=1 Tax=Paragonimus skrjabini miyazakii TaxID=59628 RepID=A0A8S9YM66_9TREM|nr:hypothetical protein EG68_07876 [Paragonimus skrjabini miyazakii]
MAEPEKKLRQMEEEMTRFEAEIAHQTANSVTPPVVPATPLTGGFAFPATTAFIPHQLRVTPHVAGPNGKERVLASITKPPLTPVVPQTSPVGQQNPLATPVVDSSKTTTVLIPPPAYRPATSTTNSSVGQTTNKKKRYIRVAAGMTWVDPTLADWDPNDFRIFCGDLGNEVSDDTLARAFNRYPSFQKARVVRDKRTSKSRGYGFVSFSDPADFMRAMREMNGKYVGNRPIKLKRSDWRSRQLETHRKKEKERKKLGLKN